MKKICIYFSDSYTATKITEDSCLPYSKEICMNLVIFPYLWQLTINLAFKSTVSFKVF